MFLCFQSLVIHSAFASIPLLDLEQGRLWRTNNLKELSCRESPDPGSKALELFEPDSLVKPFIEDKKAIYKVGTDGRYWLQIDAEQSCWLPATEKNLILVTDIFRIEDDYDTRFCSIAYDANTFAILRTSYHKIWICRRGAFFYYRSYQINYDREGIAFRNIASDVFSDSSQVLDFTNGTYSYVFDWFEPTKEASLLCLNIFEGNRLIGLEKIFSIATDSLNEPFIE
ncbi:MAG: hypothetical protein HRU19_17555 [Pseudobacteriovorax sp.]|nr:hypothetical protein [Pseudobacteriovorax sp.]